MQNIKNKKRIINNGFTLIELVVAIGLLVMVISFSSVIFTASIDGYRIATANAEIMQKLRAITDQLSSDLKGLAPITTPLTLVTQKSGSLRSDKLAFLATGDFQTTQQYDGDTICGNAASIFYSLAYESATQEPKDKILLRRQMILTSDSTLPNSDVNYPSEYYDYSLSEWANDSPFSNPNDWTESPGMDINEPDDLVMYMAKGVDDFTVQYANWNDGKLDWLPKNADDLETDFTTNAFKFMFTLYDSKGIIKNGKRFTHIVHLSKQ